MLHPARRCALPLAALLLLPGCNLEDPPRESRFLAGLRISKLMHEVTPEEVTWSGVTRIETATANRLRGDWYEHRMFLLTANEQQTTSLMRNLHAALIEKLEGSEMQITAKDEAVAAALPLEFEIRYRHGANRGRVHAIVDRAAPTARVGDQPATGTLSLTVEERARSW